MGFGFTVMYLSAAVAFVVCGAMVWFFLPSMRKEPKVATGTLEAPRRNRRDALLLFIICTLMWGTNSLYIINMPLFIIDELHLPEKLAGIMMGTAAGLEDPHHADCGLLREALRQRFLMRVAAVAGLLFYVGMLTVRQPSPASGTAAERHLHRYSGRYRHALLSGPDAGSGRLCHHPLYEYHPRGLDYCRLTGGRCG